MTRPPDAWPAWAVDLARDGASPGSPVHVIRAIRRLMISAHRAGANYAQTVGLILDPASHLGEQLRYGSGSRGRPITREQAHATLRKHWTDTARVAARCETWDRDAIPPMLAGVREMVAEADLPPVHRAVLSAVLDAADRNRTTRPAVSVRFVEARTGLPRMTVHRTLTRLHEQRTWLVRVERGRAGEQSQRAALFSLSPAVARLGARSKWDTPGGTAPVSHYAPVSHVPVSHSRGSPDADLEPTKTDAQSRKQRMHDTEQDSDQDAERDTAPVRTRLELELVFTPVEHAVGAAAYMAAVAEHREAEVARRAQAADAARRTRIRSLRRPGDPE